MSSTEHGGAAGPALRPVTVLGAGIVGICTALSLLDRGIAVRLIDRGAPGQETSFGNAGVISPWSVVPQSVPGLWKQIPGLMIGADRALSIRPRALPAMLPWGLRFLSNGRSAKVRHVSDAMEILCGPSVELYRRHLRGTGEDDLVRDAFYIHAFRDAAAARLDSLGYRLRREKGAEIERVDRAELQRLEPALSRDFEAALVIRGQARALSPGRIGKVLADKVRTLGGEIVRAPIRTLTRADRAWRIDCDGQSFTADTVVLALGAWSPSLLCPLGVRPPLMAERGYHVEFPAPGVEVIHSVMDVSRKIVASSMRDGLRVAGQAEFAPVDAPPDRSKQRRLADLARAMFPDLQDEAPRGWMGRRPSFPDSLPAIGELPGLEGLVWNFGHSHYGLMMAPKSGEIVADLLTKRLANADISALSPARFH
ncbi:MAG: FAD-dependent oxidoreductase [Pseudomonadota bacterium]